MLQQHRTFNRKNLYMCQGEEPPAAKSENRRKNQRGTLENQIFFEFLTFLGVLGPLEPPTLIKLLVPL